VLGALPALAHDPPDDERPGFGEEIEVVGHYQNRVGTSDAASAGTVNRQLVEDRPLLRPGEVLELVPGLIITQHSGAGKANQYFLRGFNLDHGTDFLTTLDGMPVNLRTHAHGQGYTDLNFVVPELVQRIDYLKGPYYASKGDFASAGAADIHLAEAVPRSTIAVTGGIFGYGRGLAMGSPHLAGGHLLYALEYMRNDGPWLRPDDYQRWNGVLRYTHPVGDGTIGFTAMAYVGTWNATDQIPLRAVQSGLIDRYGTLDPTTGGSSHRYSLSANLQQEVGGGVLRASAYGVRYDLDLFSDFTYFLDDPARGDQFEQHDRRFLVGTAGSWTAERRLGGIDTHATLGWEARQDRVSPVGLYHTAGRARLATVRQDDVRETSGGLFAQLEVAWISWLRTVAGARYDRYWFDVKSSDPRNSGDVAAGRASPKASLVLGPFARTEVFGNFGVGFHSNDARGATTTVDPASGAAVVPVTPLVRTVGTEVGLRTEIVPHAQTSIALWRLDLASELVFAGDAGTTEPSRPSRRQGIEWSTRWQPIRWLLLDLDVALSRARFTDPDPAGDRVPGSIESAVSAGVTFHELGPLSASVYLRYFGPRPLIEDDSVRSGASTIVNAQLGWRVARPVKLTLDVFNLLDARVDDIAYHYTSRLPGEPAGGVSGIHFHPAEKRSVRLAASLAF
jgi:outer membrane receptor protein involved in Fe transport